VNTEEKTVGNRDWVENALKSAQAIVLGEHEKSLAETLISQAFENATLTDTPLGLSLASAFDLFVGVEYYRRITNQGWLYCPSDEPLLLYPFVNACPRCVLNGDFHYHKANKPESGSIGTVTSRLLCVFLETIFLRTNKQLKIYRGVEPVDIIVYDEAVKTVLLAEVKAAPLTTLPLAVRVEKQTGLEADEVVSLEHSTSSNPFLDSHPLSLFLPTSEGGNHRLIALGTRDKASGDNWTYTAINRVFSEDKTLFPDYFKFWMRTYQAYDRSERQGNASVDPVYWFTNACGQPSPRPANWPKRASSGYESISDGKSSVGMDRTDDIKKGIYQVLKIGTSGKPHSAYTVKTALISNIHAVRHYDEYLSGLQDVVWALDLENKEQHKTKASDLNPDTPLYNLFDGIISFTKNFSRDEWIDETFNF
jgi:hypothetical protein